MIYQKLPKFIRELELLCLLNKTLAVISNIMIIEEITKIHVYFLWSLRRLFLYT